MGRRDAVGDALRAFNLHYARRVMRHGRWCCRVRRLGSGDPECARASLHGSDAAVIVSCGEPLLGPETYEPLTRGMRAALRSSTTFSPAQSRESRAARQPLARVVCKLTAAMSLRAVPRVGPAEEHRGHRSCVPGCRSSRDRRRSVPREALSGRRRGHRFVRRHDCTEREDAAARIHAPRKRSGRPGFVKGTSRLQLLSRRGYACDVSSDVQVGARGARRQRLLEGVGRTMRPVIRGLASKI